MRKRIEEYNIENKWVFTYIKKQVMQVFLIKMNKIIAAFIFLVFTFYRQITNQHDMNFSSEIMWCPFCSNVTTKSSLFWQKIFCLSLTSEKDLCAMLTESIEKENVLFF